MFVKPERSFVPAVGASSKGQKKNAMENSSVTLPKLSKYVSVWTCECVGGVVLRAHACVCVVRLTGSNQELGKEEKILTGTFHDGDSE